MVGVGGKRGHQLRCVFCELEARIDVLLLILLLWQPTSALPAQLMLVCCCEQLSARTPVLPPPHTTAHSTPNTHQVREQTTAHALRARRSEERVHSPRQHTWDATWLCLLFRCCMPCTRHRANDTSATAHICMGGVLLLIRALFLCVHCSLVHAGGMGCLAAAGRSLPPCRFSRLHYSPEKNANATATVVKQKRGRQLTIGL